MFKIRNPKAEIQTPNTKLQEENQKVARRNPKKSGNKFRIRFFLGNPKIFDKIQRNCLFRFTQMMQPLACKSQFWEAVNHPISTTPLCKGEADSEKSQLGSFDPEQCQVSPRSAVFWWKYEQNETDYLKWKSPPSLYCLKLLIFRTILNKHRKNCECCPVSQLIVR